MTIMLWYRDNSSYCNLSTYLVVVVAIHQQWQSLSLKVETNSLARKNKTEYLLVLFILFSISLFLSNQIFEHKVSMFEETTFVKPIMHIHRTKYSQLEIYCPH